MKKSFDRTSRLSTGLCLAQALLFSAATASAQSRILGPYITAMDREAPLLVLHTEAETEVRATLQGGPNGPLLHGVSQGRHHNFPLPPYSVTLP